jgi:hypothetical protein
MKNNGKLLESFVEEIEKILSPQGVKITPNKKIYNDHGVQTAEFDIEIEGKIGSTNFKWLIECRDRPSFGPAPGSWIEQLVGRKDRFKFNKIIAVSTTGFTDDAAKYANDSGIEIRSVTNSNFKQISDWFPFSELPLSRLSGKLKKAAVKINKDQPKKNFQALEKILENLSYETNILLDTETQKKLSFLQVFETYIKRSNELYVEFTKGTQAVKVQLTLQLPQKEHHVEIETEIGAIPISEIIFDADIFANEELIPISSIKNYHNISYDETIATQVGFNFNIKDKSHELLFNKIDNNCKIYLKVDTSKDKP